MSDPADFDRCAGRYDEQRPADTNWWEVFGRIASLGGLRGARVLDVGCGTGRLAEGLSEREGARVWGIERSEEMVAKARERGVNARVGRAESLPFRPGWFDAVVMRMVIHLLDRPRALAESARVLAPGGRIVVATEDVDGFDGAWLTAFFPSVPAIDRARFPSAKALQAELAEAGFADVRLERLRQQRTISRADALDIIGTRAYSTFALIDHDEYARGLARAEAELRDELSYTFDWLLAVATR